jgi:hypothetical protein
MNGVVNKFCTNVIPDIDAHIINNRILVSYK